MRLPWKEPGSSGEAPGGDVDDERFFSVSAARRVDSMIPADSPLLTVLSEFARRHKLVVGSHRNGPFENWSFTCNYQRMQRMVSVHIRERAGRDAHEISVGASAVWYAKNDEHPEIPAHEILFTVREEHHWRRGFTMNDAMPIEDALEGAFVDAKNFSVEDLEERPVRCRPEAHNP